MNLSLSILIPCYNEGATLKNVVDQVARQKPLVRQIVIANDGSSDQTRQMIDDIARGWSDTSISLKVTHLKPNKGKGAAVRAALALAQEPYILIQDADLELDPSNYAALVKPVEAEKAQVVFGDRFPNGYPLHSRWASHLANWIVTTLSNVLFGLKLKDQACGYKLMPTKMARELDLQADGFEICSEMTAKLGLRHVVIASVPVRYTPRTNEQGKKIRWVDGIIAVRTLFYYRCTAK